MDMAMEDTVMDMDMDMVMDMEVISTENDQQQTIILSIRDQLIQVMDMVLASMATDMDMVSMATDMDMDMDMVMVDTFMENALSEHLIWNKNTLSICTFIWQDHFYGWYALLSNKYFC